MVPFDPTITVGAVIAFFSFLVAVIGILMNWWRVHHPDLQGFGMVLAFVSFVVVVLVVLIITLHPLAVFFATLTPGNASEIALRSSFFGVFLGVILGGLWVTATQWGVTFLGKAQSKPGDTNAKHEPSAPTADPNGGTHEE